MPDPQAFLILPLRSYFLNKSITPHLKISVGEGFKPSRLCTITIKISNGLLQKFVL
jgi:hypothetical protein